ncbi:hypothetical protein [Bosea sp. RAC05]|uniref:hypothetical protein n=1 Tax=Bosea sp. RAC05 TaxID=1842539 RepID=UPI00083CD0E3|nr:hypothetical protein [Bosea sp. RAC05]AOG03442.1 hypothetical protein BSY19_4847 [Bosea sp. RAC05]
MQIIVSAQLLARMRTLLGASIPAAKSSHRAEAIALGLGFNSNAALIAWQKAVAHSEVRLRDLDPNAFAERLEVLSGITNIDGGLAGSAAAGCLAAVTGPSFEEVLSVGQKAFFAEKPAGDWQALTPRQKYTQLAFLLRWRMLMTGMIANLVEDYSDEVDVAGRLAAVFGRHADYDPLIAGFLCDWLLAAAAKHDVEWGDAIYETFRPRIKAFMEAICRTWDEEIDPLTLRPTGKRYVADKRDHLTISTSLKSVGPLSFWDTGLEEFSEQAIPGLALMAHWMSGASHEELARLDQRIRKSGYGDLAPGVQLLDENGADVGQMELVRHSASPYALDEIRPGGFEFWSKASIVLADVDTASRAAKLMAEAGYRIMILDAASEDFEQRFKSGIRMDPEMIWIDNAGSVPFEWLARLDAVGVLAFVSGVSPDVGAQAAALAASLDLRPTAGPKPA